MPTSLKSALGGGSSGGLIGSTKLIMENATTRYKPVLDLNGATYIRSGFLSVGEQATYPEAYASFSKYSSLNPVGTRLDNLSNPNPAATTNIAYGNGVLITMTSNGSAGYRSPDNGANWYQFNLPGNARWTVAFGNGVFVAVGVGNVYVLTSTDGVSWTSTNINASVPSWNLGLKDIAFGSGVFVITNNNVGNVQVLVSSDGTTWKAVTYANNTVVVAGYLTFVGSVFVMTHYTNSSNIYVSSDGLNWTQRAFPAVYYPYNTHNRIVSASLNGVIVIAGGDYQTGCNFVSLDNGATWSVITYTGTKVGKPPQGAVTGGTIKGLMFLLINTGSSNGWVIVSKDGKNWTDAALTGTDCAVDSCVGYSFPDMYVGLSYNSNTGRRSTIQYTGLQLGVGIPSEDSPARGVYRYMRIK